MSISKRKKERQRKKVKGNTEIQLNKFLTRYDLSLFLFFNLLFLSLHLSLFLLFHFLPLYSITENQLHSIKFFLFSLHQILFPLFFLHSFMATTKEPSSWKKKMVSGLKSEEKMTLTTNVLKFYPLNCFFEKISKRTIICFTCAIRWTISSINWD